MTFKKALLIFIPTSIVFLTILTLCFIFVFPKLPHGSKFIDRYILDKENEGITLSSNSLYLELYVDDFTLKDSEFITKVNAANDFSKSKELNRPETKTSSFAKFYIENEFPEADLYVTLYKSCSPNSDACIYSKISSELKPGVGGRTRYVITDYDYFETKEAILAANPEAN